MSKDVTYSKLFFVFSCIGIMMFGGGYGMLPLLEKEIVEKRKWATNEDLADYFAIGQCTPGVIAVNTATFIGMKLKGIKGAIAATLGLVFPSFIIIMSIAKAISVFSEYELVQKAFTGIRVCVCVLIFSALIKLWKSSIKGKLTFSIFFIAVICSVFLNVSPVIIVLVDIGFGIALEVGISLKEGKV